MRGFRVWIREQGFIVEGMEWTDETILARRFDFEPHAFWQFKNIAKARDYFHVAFGPDAHVIFSGAGELRFEVPGLLPVRPSEPGNDHVSPPEIAQPETPELQAEEKVNRRRARAPLKAQK